MKPEQIVMLLRQIEVLTANGKTLVQPFKETGVGEQNYYRWRKMYGGTEIDQAKRYKELEQENTRLKNWYHTYLREVITGNYGSKMRMLTMIDEFRKKC